MESGNNYLFWKLLSENSLFSCQQVHCYMQSHIQINEYRDHIILLLTIISTLDDLNYLEKTNTYYIVNVPDIFSACWKVAKPLLQERTRKNIQVLPGSGRDELLKIMDFGSLPHFCRRQDSGSSRCSENKNCLSLDLPFHQQLYNYIKQQSLVSEPIQPVKHGSFHVDLPEPAAEGTEIAKTIESELHKIENRNGLYQTLGDVRINDC